VPGTRSSVPFIYSVEGVASVNDLSGGLDIQNPGGTYEEVIGLFAAQYAIPPRFG
jgi:hypothetical protein